MRKNGGAIDDIFHLFNLDTQKTIDDFISHYDEKSKVQYKNSIVNMLNDLNKKDISQVTYKDYETIKQSFERKVKKTQDKYRITFFKYIYSYNKLDNDLGFNLDKEFDKDKEIKHFEKLLKKRKKDEFENKRIVEYSEALNFEQVEIITDLINMECNIENMDKYKLSFILYMLYETDYSIDDLKFHIKTSDFQKGILKAKNGKEFIIPEKYWDLMKVVIKDKYIRFATTDLIVRNFGNTIGIEDLKPYTIRLARKQNTIKCPICGIENLNKINHWTAINNRIICLECSKVLKKKFINSKETRINNVIVERLKIEDDMDLSKYVFTFDELRNQLNDQEDLRNKLNNYFEELQKFKNKVGVLGERYVYEKEKQNLIGTKYHDMVDISPSNSPNKGFDILSYDLEGNELYIEVKTEAYSDNDFYISENERIKGLELTKNNKKYLIYRVHNILAKDKNDISMDKIENIFEKKEYDFTPCNWRVIKK